MCLSIIVIVRETETRKSSTYCGIINGPITVGNGTRLATSGIQIAQSTDSWPMLPRAAPSRREVAVILVHVPVVGHFSMQIRFIPNSSTRNRDLTLVIISTKTVRYTEKEIVRYLSLNCFLPFHFVLLRKT